MHDTPQGVEYVHPRYVGGSTEARTVAAVIAQATRDVADVLAALLPDGGKAESMNVQLLARRSGVPQVRAKAAADLLNRLGAVVLRDLPSGDGPVYEWDGDGGAG